MQSARPRPAGPAIDVSNGEPKLFYSDGELIPYGEDKIFSGNCFQGHLLANPDKGTIVYVERSYPLVEFYDDSLRLVRSITGPDNLKPEYLNDGSYLFYAKIYGYPYGPICCDDSYIYLRYDDNIDTENPIMTTQMEDGIPTIRSYRLEGMTGCSVITSGGDGILYACTKDPETEQLSILRYKLF